MSGAGIMLMSGHLPLGSIGTTGAVSTLIEDFQHADALVAADISAGAVLVMQAKESVGVLAPELERGSNFQYVVHQAAASGSTMSPGSRSGPRELICLEKGCWPERS